MAGERSSMDMPEQGYLYIVCGDRKYFDEAIVSAESLKERDPEAHLTLVSDRNLEGEHCFDNVIVDREDAEGGHVGWKRGLLFKTKHIYASSPYQKTFFVDSDTYFTENCGCLFDVLDYYDVSLAHGTNDRTVVNVRGKAVDAVTPYNTGVILFRKNQHTERHFADWHACYEKNLKKHPHDQPAFVEALSTSHCKVYILQNNWNARFIYPEKYAGRVMILHGRHNNFPALARRINSTQEARLWLPQAEACISSKIRADEAFRVVRYLARRVFAGFYVKK